MIAVKSAGFVTTSMLASSRFLLLVVEMRAFTIAAIITVLAVPANAQMAGHSKGGSKLGQKSDEQIAVEQQKKKNEETQARTHSRKLPIRASRKKTRGRTCAK